MTKNFKKSEFDSKDGSKMPPEVEKNINLLAADIQVIRDYLGEPIRINSGYRSVEHNRKIGGVKDSYHTKGQAADLGRFPGSTFTPKQLYGLIMILIQDKKIKNGGVGLYDTFVHYDHGASGRRWDNRKIIV